MKRSKIICICLVLALVAAAQAVGLFFLMRTQKATALTLSETALVLKMDQGVRITYTIEPASASGKLLKYKVSASDPIVAWVDEQNDMIIAVSPGTCTIAAEVDGLCATVAVTVTDETVLAGAWQSAAGDVRLTLDGSLSGRLETPAHALDVQLFYGAFSDGENADPNRWIKLSGEFSGAPLILYYDRLSDTLLLDGQRLGRFAQ